MKKRKFTNQEIQEIAEQLGDDFKIYLNTKTLEIITEIDKFSPYYDPIPETEASWKRIEEQWEDLVEIEKMPPHKAFNIMEAFAEQVSDKGLQNSLWDALRKRKPFRQFKNVIDSSSVRDAWYAFEEEIHRNWVRRKLTYYTEQE